MKEETFIRMRSSAATNVQQTGLYDAAYEHDACGVGMIVDIHGNKSHDLVDSALKVLENMKHRGAEGADNKTGDGAGIMVQIPHEFILLQGIPVPEKGKYGTGLVFLPKNEKEQAQILSVMLEEIEREGLTLMHLRSVPVNSVLVEQEHRLQRDALISTSARIFSGPDPALFHQWSRYCAFTVQHQYLPYVELSATVPPLST